MSSVAYKVKIEAFGANGAKGSTNSSGGSTTQASGGYGGAVTAEYIVLDDGDSNGAQTDSSGNLVWKIKYRSIAGGAGGTVNVATQDGGKGGDGVEVFTNSRKIVIGGGGGGGGGDQGYGNLYKGGDANQTGTTPTGWSHFKVDGEGGAGQSAGNSGGGGANAVGGAGGANQSGQTYENGTAGTGYTDFGSGGQGGAGATKIISGDKNYCGGGGGGGGWGGGGGGVSGNQIAAGGGAGSSLIWNNKSSAGFKYIDTVNYFGANTSESVFLKFTSYQSTNSGTTWDKYWENDFSSSVTTTIENFNIPLNNVPDFNTITTTSVGILSDQSYTWDLTLKSGTYDGDEQYSIFTSGTYSEFTYSNPSVTINTGGVTRGTVDYDISTRKLTFTGSGLEHDNVTSYFQVYVKDPTITGNGNASTSVSVTQHKRLFKHESIKTFTASPPIANTGLITSSGVDIATLFQPKSFLNFEHTSTIGGKFFSSSSDLSGVFGEYKSDYSGNDIISTDTGFQIGGTDIRHIYAARQPSLDIFDTSPGGKNYRFTLTANTSALLICVGGGGAGNHGNHGGQGGHGGKIIVQELTMSAGNYDLSFNVGAGEDINSSAPVTRRGGDSSIIGNSLNSNTAVADQLTDWGYNDNLGGERSNDAQNGGFQLKYGVNTYYIGGGGGGGRKKKAIGADSAGDGYFGGQNGYTDNTTSTRAEYGGGGGGGFQHGYNSSSSRDGGSGGHGLCAILFKP